VPPPLARPRRCNAHSPASSAYVIEEDRKRRDGDRETERETGRDEIFHDMDGRYNAHSSAYDALAAGVPVLTVPGALHTHTPAAAAAVAAVPAIG
jgi:hypothetical protein